MAANRNASKRGDGASGGLRRETIGELTLTKLQNGDLNRIVEIEGACYPNPWSLDSFQQVLEDDKTFGTLGARLRSNRLIGYIIFTEVVDELHILNVSIDPKYRRRGIATMMLIHLHQAALRRGRVVSYLEVRASNTAAQQMYAKFGYTPLARRADYYTDNNEDAILMVTNLKKPEK